MADGLGAGHADRGRVRFAARLTLGHRGSAGGAQALEKLAEVESTRSLRPEPGSGPSMRGPQRLDVPRGNGTPTLFSDPTL